MNIGQQFNRLTIKEYFFYIDNYKKYTDFNTLGLYRSILENEKLDISEKVAVRDYAHKMFSKTFEFLQLKDPYTFVKVSTLGQELTDADERQLWEDVRRNQERILKDKKIKHRNFGKYSKHNCGYDTCPYNGLMIRQGSFLAEGNMHFATDKNRYSSKLKAERQKKARKAEQQTIRKIIEEE